MPGTSDQLILRNRVPASPAVAEPAWQPGGACEASQAAPAGSQTPPGAVTIVTPSESAATPPDLARSYPDAAGPGNSRWGISMSQMLPEAVATEIAPRTHTIVDGDSLAALAERYLGSKDAAAAIFAVNRDVLSDPQILPIGVELRIPAKAEGETAAGGGPPPVPGP